MRNKSGILLLAVSIAIPLLAQNDGTPSSVLPRVDSRSHAIVLDILFSPAPPDPTGPYHEPSKWIVQWRAGKSEPWTPADVAGVSFGESSVSLSLKPLSASKPDPDPRTIFWNVAFVAPHVEATAIDFAPNPSTRSCDNPANKPFFCPPAPNQPPDLSFSGSFLAGGGTNPIYSFELKGGILFPRRHELTNKPTSNLQMGINTQIEINQNPEPPVHRTRFDPDSISAGFAVTDLVTFDHDNPVLKKPLLRGMRFQAQLPEGEFSRIDPSSSILASGLATFDFRPWHPASHSSFYGTLYPFLGMEAGRNLNRPRVVEGIPVDLSHYQGIVRGYMGVDATLAMASPTRQSNVFAITGAYRVRIPAIDEPFFETLHQVTTVSLTTKARHWIEADLSYTLPSWKYLALSGQYQYGELPPFFPFVNHKFTIGFTIQAVQSKAPGSKLVQ